MQDFSLREVVEMAIRTEKLGHAYYTEFSDRFINDKDIHDLFVTLADREVTHEVRFGMLRDAIGDETPEGWAEVSEYMRAFVESAFFLGKDRAMAHMQNMRDAQAAVTMAIMFEKETLLYFYGMRDAVADKDRSVVDEIINEEKKHIVQLVRLKEKYS
jgi:rubrerythrin